MKKVQALPVFLSLMLMSSVSLTPAKASIFSDKELSNQYHKIDETVLKKSTTISSNKNINSLNQFPLHTEYKVKSRDTFLSIAQLYSISSKDIQKSNSWLQEPLKVGQTVYVPLFAEQVHYVSWGDSIYSIANRYGVEVVDIIMLNPFLNIETLAINQEIKIPKTKKNTVQVNSINANTFNSAITWPVEGVITSAFGPRWGGFHTGIDIWNENKKKTSVAAALSGTVIFADWSNSGYGQLVIIDHGNNIQTYYAHLSKVLIKQGQKIRQGDVLGMMGETGNAIGVHLHFELRFNEIPVNPYKYLAKQI